MAWSPNFKSSWGMQQSPKNGDKTMLQFNGDQHAQFRQNTITSPTPSRDGAHNPHAYPSTLMADKSEPHDFIFLRVKNWSQCSRCLWHLEHLLSENINIYHHQHVQEAPFIDHEHEASPFMTATEEEEVSLQSIASLSPLRLSSYLTSDIIKKCESSPLTPPRYSPHFGSAMVKSRSLPNIQDALPFIDAVSPMLKHVHPCHHRKYQMRMCDIDKRLVTSQSTDNVEAVGYGSTLGECKDKKTKVQLTQTTSLRFLYEYYRIVITLDISSSIGVMNPTTRCITFEHYYPMLRDFLLLISQPMNFECLATPRFPTLYICIIAVGLPSKPLVLLLNDQIRCDYNTATVDNMIKRLYDEFQKLQTNIVQQLRETHSCADDKRLNVDWEDIIHHSLFCLDRMPAIGCPNIVVITDGMLSLENCNRSVLAQVLRRDVSVNTLQTTQRQFSPNAPFAHVPDSDLLEFFCRFTNGILVDHKTLHQQYEARFGDDIDNDKNIDDRYNKTTASTHHSEYEKAAMFSQFHHFKHKKNPYNHEQEEDIDDDSDSDLNSSNIISIDNVDMILDNGAPAKWFRNKVDALFKGDNLVQLGVLVRSSSLSNQVFESSASSMLASWTNLVQSQARRHRSLHRSTSHMMHKLPDPLLMGHFERVQWYKASYIVNLSRSVLIRARTNEGFKNANIICKGDYSYYNHGQYINQTMETMETASINSNDSRYPLENNQIFHMFHEWKHRVVIEYQMIFSVPCISEYEPMQSKVNLFIIGSSSFLTNLVKYLAQKDKTQNIRSQQFAELEEFIQDIKRMDKALSKLVFDKEVINKRKFSTLLNYLEQKIWHDVVFQDVLCVPWQVNKTNYKIKTWIENQQINTPNVWQKVRDALKEWASFDLEYNNSQIIKFVRSFHEYGGFAVVVFEQLHECDWLVSLKIEAQGPVSRRLYRLIKDSVVGLIQQTVSLEQYKLQFLDKPIHNLLLLDFNDCIKCSNNNGQDTPAIIRQEIQLIRAYLHTYSWFIAIPSKKKSYVRNVMAMFTDLKLREGFNLILNHSHGRILGYWIYSNDKNKDQTSFVQININKISKGLQIELAVEPTPCKYTFGHTTLGTKDILYHLRTWTHQNIQKIVSIVGSFYASSRTIKEIRIHKQTQLQTLRASNISKTTSVYNSDSDSADDHGIRAISNKLRQSHILPLPSTPQPVTRQESASRLLKKKPKKKLLGLKTRKKKSSKAKIGSTKSRARKSLGKITQTPKIKHHSSVPASSPKAAALPPQQSVVFDFKKKQSILSNEDVFRGCDLKYKAKLNDITLYAAESVKDFTPLLINDAESDLDAKTVLEPLDVMIELLQHSDVNHRVFAYELDYHQQMLNTKDESVDKNTKTKIETSAQLLLQLLLKTVKCIADIEIINDRIYCYDITPSKETVIDSHNLLYIVLPSKMHPIPALDETLSKFKPIGENCSDYLYLFEVSKQIISTTTNTSLYDEKEYGIIAHIMPHITFRKPTEIASDSTRTPSLSAITPRSMLDHCLSRLRQNHARNKARIIYFDLINQIDVPLNRIEFAINKCCQFREDFNISLLKKLMIASLDDDQTQNSTTQTAQFADKLLGAVEATCQAQFKYLPQLDAYFYIPMDYKHKFVDGSSSAENKCIIEEDEELRDEEIHHSSSANDADDNQSFDEDLEGSDSSEEHHVNDDIPQSESERLKITIYSAQEKRMHRRVRKSGTMTPISISIGRDNAFNSILPDIYATFNQSTDTMLMGMDHASSAPPPEAFASPFDNPAPHSLTSSIRHTRSFSSPIVPAVEDANRLSSSSLTTSQTTKNALPYPLFIRFNVIIHGTANRFRSVSVNDIKKEALYTQHCSAICLNAIIMTTPPSSLSMGLDTKSVSLDDINSLSMDQFNDTPFIHSQSMSSITSLNTNDNDMQMVPALDTKNILQLPVMFVGLYRRFSRKLRAQIARIVLHQLRSSTPVNADMVLQQLSFLEPNQYHLFSHIVHFIDKMHCFDLLPMYMATCIMPDIKLEKVNLNYNFGRFHKSHLWFAMHVDDSEGGLCDQRDVTEGMYEHCSIPYWVFICISEDVNNVVNASFLIHIHPDDAASYKIQAIEKKFRAYMEKTIFLINQQALLQELNKTKVMNRFLVPIEENYNERNSKSIPEEPRNTTDNSFNMFKPGEFKADEQLILPFVIHRRVDPRSAKYHLEQILMRFRCGTTDIFVFREQGGNIFYFKCEVARFDQSYHINDETIIEQEHDDKESNLSDPSPLTQTTGTSMIRFLFYGQTKPGEQITKELKQTLYDQLGDFTQRTMITLLQKNPKFLFNHIDYRFLCPSNGSPKASRCYPLPEFVSDLYLFILFLKQNIATHLGIHSIRITPDENRLSCDTQPFVSDDSKDHPSPTPGTTPGLDSRETALSLDAFAPKSFRVKISSEDISFVYFTLPRERKYKRKPRKSSRTGPVSIDPNAPNLTVGGTDSSTTNKRMRYQLSAFSSQNMTSSTQQHISNEATSFPMSSASPQFDEEPVEEDTIYKLGQSFGNGLAVLTCGFITTDNDYISHAKTCINPQKSNDLSSMLINPDRSLKSLAFLLQNIPIVKPQSLDTIKGGHLRVWKGATSLLRQQLNALQHTEPHLMVPQPPALLKLGSNSTFFGSASPRGMEPDFDPYGAINACIDDMDSDTDSDMANEFTEDEEFDETKEVEQRTFAIELWSRSDSAINTNELLTQFNAAINQSLHEYAIEWLCVLFHNTLLDEYAKREERMCNMVYLYLLKPLLSVMSSSIRLSAAKMNFKCKTCHHFQHSFPRMFWRLGKVTKSVLLELSHTFPSMPVYVLTRGTSHQLHTHYQFMSSNEDQHVFLDEPSPTHIIIGGIRICGDVPEERKQTVRSRSASRCTTDKDKRYKLYGPKRLSSTRSALHRHNLFIGMIEPTGLKLYYYNCCLDKIKKFQLKMDQLTTIIQERCHRFNAIMLNRMGLSSAFMGPPVQSVKSRSRTTSRESTVHLRAMKSGATVDSLDSASINVFESLWSTPSSVIDMEPDSIRGICGVSNRRLYELGMSNPPTESLSNSPMLSASAPTLIRSKSVSSLTSPPRLFALNLESSQKLNETRQQRREENEKSEPKRKSYCITKDPVDVHFLITEKRLNESTDKTLQLNEISKLILRAKYLNELILDNHNIHWQSKRDELQRFGIKIHEVHCPFLIECVDDEEHHKLIEYISWTFITDLCKYLENKIVSLHRLVDCLFHHFEMDQITRQILIIPDLSRNEVTCTFYLLPETAYTCCINSNISERHSLHIQQEYLRNVLEDLQSAMWMDLTVFVSKWCTQWIIQILSEEFKPKPTTKDNRRKTTNSMHLDANILHEMDWKQSIQRLFISNEQIHDKLAKIDIQSKDQSVLVQYKMKIPRHRRYVNQKETKRDRKPLFEWFGRYGFKTLHQKNLAFIVSHDHCFGFEGNRYSNQMYHSKLTEVAIIVLMFGEEHIDAFYLENNKSNLIQFVRNTSNHNDTHILKYLNAPFGNHPDDTQLQNASHQMTVSAANTPTIMPTQAIPHSPLSELLVFSNYDKDHASLDIPSAPRTKPMLLLAKSFSLDIVNPLNESNHSLERYKKQEEKETPIEDEEEEIHKPKAHMQHMRMHSRRWSVSENVEEIKSNGFDLKHTLIAHTMEVSLVEIVTEIVSLWYVLPDCELTFLCIIDSIWSRSEDDPASVYHDKIRRLRTCADNMYLSSIYNALDVAQIDISRLKKLRKYYWRKPLKYVVQQFLAHAQSPKEEHALIAILSNLQSCVIGCEDPLNAFVSFSELCKSSEKMRSTSIEVVASLSPSHLFIYCECLQQQQLLIHFFLSQSKMSDEGDNNNKKLVMEVIGRTNPKESVMNRQCLSDLIELISLFLDSSKRKTHL
eukprot:266148_1